MEDPFPLSPLPPQAPPDKSPADLALEAEGGEIRPTDLSPAPPPLDFKRLNPTAAATPTPATEPRRIDAGPPAAPDAAAAAGGPPVPGVALVAPPSPEQLAYVRRIEDHVNFEVNVYLMCVNAVDNMVRLKMRSEPPDAAEFSQFEAGKRSPLEASVPAIAVEVYREVRLNMRADEQDARGILALIGRGVRRIFR